jgi:N6-L-threonylcarbamoyladenine synthase
VAKGMALALNKPVLGIHHLEGHLLSPLLADDANIQFPFVALLVSGGHTQLMKVTGVGEYSILGETLDDAAGEAFDKTAKMLGLNYPGGPAVSNLAKAGNPSTHQFPRPMKHSGDLDFSFAGLKTSVLTQVKKLTIANDGPLSDSAKADVARGFVDAIVEVLVSKSINALKPNENGKTVFKDLIWSESSKSYKGILINPDNGDEFKIEIKLFGIDRFKFSAGKFIFSRTFTFNRISE